MGDKVRKRFFLDSAATIASLYLLALFLNSPRIEFYPLKIAAGVSVGLAIVAFALKGVSAGGAVTGAVSAFIFFAVGRVNLFVILLLVFVLTLAATWLSSRRLARRPAPRTAVQVAANLAVPSTILVWAMWNPGHLIPVPLVLASLAELCGDTVSGEIGEAYGRTTRLITTLQRVEKGVDGGMSTVGTLAGTAATLLVIGCAVVAFYPFMPQILHFWGWGFFWTAAIGGIVGMLVDSVLGATLESRGWLNNEAVNFLGTASAAGVAWYLLRLSSQLNRLPIEARSLLR